KGLDDASGDDAALHPAAPALTLRTSYLRWLRSRRRRPRGRRRWRRSAAGRAGLRRRVRSGLRARLLDLPLLRAGLRFNGVRFMHRLLKALDGFAQAFTKLRELSGPEDDQHDEENQDQLGDAHASKHCCAPSRWLRLLLLRLRRGPSRSKPLLEPL